MPIEGLLCDLDNTLIDFLRAKRLASEEAARAMIASGADLGIAPERAGSMLYEHYMAHGIESDDAFETFLQKHLRGKISYSRNEMDRILAAGINAYLRTKDVVLAPYPTVVPTLVELTRRGVRLAVVTDAPRLKAWQRLHQVGLASFFSTVVTSEDTGLVKPHRRVFETALEAMALSPNRVAMVGDWPERDLEGAAALGIRTVFAAYGAPGVAPGRARGDLAIQTFGQILEVLDVPN